MRLKEVKPADTTIRKKLALTLTYEDLRDLSQGAVLTWCEGYNLLLTVRVSGDESEEEEEAG